MVLCQHQFWKFSTIIISNFPSVSFSMYVMPFIIVPQINIQFQHLAMSRKYIFSRIRENRKLNVGTMILIDLLLHLFIQLVFYCIPTLCQFWEPLFKNIALHALCPLSIARQWQLHHFGNEPGINNSIFCCSFLECNRNKLEEKPCKSL